MLYPTKSNQIKIFAIFDLKLKIFEPKLNTKSFGSKIKTMKFKLILINYIKYDSLTVIIGGFFNFTEYFLNTLQQL